MTDNELMEAYVGFQVFLEIPGACFGNSDFQYRSLMILEISERPNITNKKLEKLYKKRLKEMKKACKNIENQH